MQSACRALPRALRCWPLLPQSLFATSEAGCLILNLTNDAAGDQPEQLSTQEVRELRSDVKRGSCPSSVATYRLSGLFQITDTALGAGDGELRSAYTGAGRKGVERANSELSRSWIGLDGTLIETTCEKVPSCD